MKPKRIASWEKIREKGPWRYGLIYGGIWGFFVVAFMIVVNYFFNKDPRALSLPYLFMWTIIYIPVGILLYRFFMWKVNENNYQKWLLQEKNDKTQKK